MHKIIYVTGITGFIGSNLLSPLLQQYKKVANFTRNKTLQIYEKDTVQEVDISDEFFIKNPSDVVINLATLYKPNPGSVEELENLIEANIRFPASVFNAFVPAENFKIINALSYHQLLDFKAQNVYSLSKELFKKFLDHQKCEVVSLYIFDTFGSGDTRDKVVDIFIKNILPWAIFTAIWERAFKSKAACFIFTGSILSAFKIISSRTAPAEYAKAV